MIPPLPEDETRLKYASPSLFNHIMFRIFPTCLKSRNEVIYVAEKYQHLHTLFLKLQLNCYLNLLLSINGPFPFQSFPHSGISSQETLTAQWTNLKVKRTCCLHYFPSCNLSFLPTTTTTTTQTHCSCSRFLAFFLLVNVSNIIIYI